MRLRCNKGATVSNLLIKYENAQLCRISLNRVNKHNAFDKHLLIALQTALDTAISNPQVRVIILDANGSYFSVGADLSWMQHMAKQSEQENMQDAWLWAKLLLTMYKSPKPIIAAIQGDAFGGGVGLVAACDIAISINDACFSFSEVKWGLIPALISPYIVKAIGARAAKCLFMSAEKFDAKRGQQLGLIHYCVTPDELIKFTINYAQQMLKLAPQAMTLCKTLVEHVNQQEINEQLMHYTTQVLAQKCAGTEAQHGLQSFFNKVTPDWNTCNI